MVGQHDRLRAIPDLELAQEPGHVRLDGGVADEELAPDLGIGQAEGDESKDV